MNKAVFITGTGTGVGKTIVTAALLRALLARGVDAVSMKPVQTGAVRAEEALRAPDLEVHCRAAGFVPTEDEYRLMAPYLYEPACSPHLAGRVAGRYPDITHILECAETLRGQHDLLLVEGAGGVMVPLDESTLTLELMQRLGYPVLVVAHIGLGTINHTLLTLEVLRHAGLDVLGVVFNEPEPYEETAIKADNPATISRLGKAPTLGTVKYLGPFDPADGSAWDTLASALSEVISRLP